MSTLFKHHAALLPLLYTIIDTASASPVPAHLFKRHMTAGAQAGLGIGIAVAIIIVGLVITFFITHLRRRARNDALNKERAILAGEKNADGTDKPDKFEPEPQVSAIPRRNKSVKDRLMGPLYRESMALPTLPNRAKLAGNSNGQSPMTPGDGESFLNKPWAGGENSPRPSFSSKRATRMMMMM